MSMICINCYQQGKPRDIHAGSGGAEVILYLLTIPFLCIPGLIYSHWRVKNGTKVCRACGGAMIPEDSPRGQKLLKNIQNK